MEKKISMKTIYLLLVISLGLVGLGIGSTYALFTISAEIDNPISLKSELSYSGDIIDTIEIELEAKETIRNTLTVSNRSGSNLNYTVWYLDEGNDIEVGTYSGTPTGSLAASGTTAVYVDVRNLTNSKIKVILGISSSSNSVVLGTDMKAVPSEPLPVKTTIIDYITSLYTSGIPTLITQETSGDSYYYSYQDDTNTWGLMNDGLKVDNTLDATTTSLAVSVTDTTALTTGTEGNIRYFGPSDSVNNYIYFNCSDYSNQSSSTCETWRIIGIVDGKVKLIRSSSLDYYSYDYTSTGEYDNNWSDATLNTLLNTTYYNSGSTTYYNGSTTGTSVSFASNGITVATRNANLISESTWYTNGMSDSDIYANASYEGERTGTSTYLSNIGLAYPSDYGYGADLNTCTNTIYNYEAEECTSVNWLTTMFTTDDCYWLITPHSVASGYVWFVAWGFVDSYNSNVRKALGVVPVLYLNSELTIESGHEGTSIDPYRISIS